MEPEDIEQVAGLAGVVAAVHVHGREQILAVCVAVLRERADHVHDPGQGGLQQRRVVIACPRGDQVQRDAVVVAGHRPLGALFAAVDRAAPGDLAPARGLVIAPSTDRSSRSRPIIWS